MLYKLLLFPARIFIHFYCRKLVINKKYILNHKGPLLIAANHPNSFLDAIILSTIFKNPIHSLTRGDAFAGKLITRILASFNMLPVYRISEGAENIESNYNTFKVCQNIFKQNGIVLIFSEGRCINEWHLRPLKKGTARLAIDAWQNGINLKVLPLGINYSCFRKYGKIIFLNFGNMIERDDININPATGKTILEFNQKLKGELQNLVLEIDKEDQKKLKDTFLSPQPTLKKILLFIPALLGFILNVPLYYSIHLAINKKAEDHYDSIITGLLFFIYPIYVLVITLIALLVFKSVYVLFLIIFLPFTTWSYLHIKDNF